MKYYMDRGINNWFDRGFINFRVRSFLHLMTTTGVEVCHLGWQLYGNFIYFEWRGKTPENDEDFQKCMDDKNNSVMLCMFLFLIVGYLYFLVFIYVFVVVS